MMLRAADVAQRWRCDQSHVYKVDNQTAPDGADERKETCPSPVP